MIVHFIIPLKTVSESNVKEHWSKSAKRHKAQKQMIKYWFLQESVPKYLPVVVTMTRLSPRFLDDDNLQTAFKYVRDAIAEYFIPGLAVGRADDDPRITWKYSQEKSTAQGMSLLLDYPPSEL